MSKRFVVAKILPNGPLVGGHFAIKPGDPIDLSRLQSIDEDHPDYPQAKAIWEGTIKERLKPVRILIVQEELYDRLWKRLLPQQRQRVEWSPCEALLIRDSEGPIVVATGKWQIINVLPQRILDILRPN